MPSISECRQPYLLSNLLLVTESLTLIAGNSRLPAVSISYSRWTPVVVSSVTPLMPAAIRVQRCGSCGERAAQHVEDDPPLLAVVLAVGRDRAGRLELERPCAPAGWRRRRRRGSCSGRGRPASCSTCSVHHQYSSRVSPFQAKTGTPCGSSGVPSGPTATAAAAWSWVEKMLQEAQRTWAPSATSVSISTAVCTVMCSEPVIRAPASGLLAPYSARSAIRPGHLVLGEADLVPAGLGQAQIGDLEVECHVSLSFTGGDGHGGRTTAREAGSVGMLAAIGAGCPG